MVPDDQNYDDIDNMDLCSSQQENNPIVRQENQLSTTKQTIRDTQQQSNTFGLRKSIGRRVSFATTARVRLYEREEGLSSESSSDSDNSLIFDSNESVQKKAFSIWKPTSLTTNIDEEENTMVVTACVGGILNEIKDNITDSHDMELTTCIGGVLSTSESNNSSENPTYMNMTECVGKVLNDHERDMNMTECVGQIVESSPFSDTKDGAMEMTTCIGEIIASEVGTASQASINNIDSMQLTACIGNVINEPEQTQSNDTGNCSSFEVFVDDEISFALYPQNDSNESSNVQSPSHISTPNTFQTKKSQLWRVSSSPIHLSTLRESRVSLNRDSLNPGTPKWAPYTTPIHASIAQLSSGTRRTSSLVTLRTPDILKNDVSFINTIEKPQIFDMMDSPLSNRHSNDHHSLLSTSRNSIQSINHLLPITPSKLSLKSTKEETSILFSPKSNTKRRQSSISIKQTLHAIPTMKEFLSSIGIRFLDHVSSSARRETLARLHDERSPDGGYLREKLILSMCVHQPENQLYEQGCSVLEEKISEAKSMLDGLETKFVSQPPSCVVSNQDLYSSEWIQKFKSLKSHARNQVKDQWYNWRKNHLIPLDGLYADHIQRLQSDGDTLSLIRGQIEVITNQISTLKNTLIEHHNALKKEKHILATTDWSLYHDLVNQKEQNDSQIDQLKFDIERVQMEQSDQWEHVNDLCMKRDSVMDQLGQVHNDIDSIIEIDALEIESNRLVYDLLCKTLGIYPKRLSKEKMEFTCQPLKDLKIHLTMSHSTPVIQVLSNDVSQITSSFCCKILPKILKNVPLIDIFMVLYEEIFRVKELDDEIMLASLNYPFEVLSTDDYIITRLSLDVKKGNNVIIDILHSNTSYQYYVSHTVNNENVTSRHDNIALSQLLKQITAI